MEFGHMVLHEEEVVQECKNRLIGKAKCWEFMVVHLPVVIILLLLLFISHL